MSEHAERNAINHFVGTLAKEIRILESAGIGPEHYLDGDKGNIISLCRRLFRDLAIDAETIRRLDTPNPLTPSDPMFAAIFGAFGRPAPKSKKKLR